MEIQAGIGKSLFPGYSAALTLVKDHGVDGARHAARALQATTGVARLDAAIRAMTSFDHAVDNATKLPLEVLVPSAQRFISGYDAAREAVMLLVNSGVVAGAREFVGRATVQAARAELESALSVNAADRSKFGGHLAAGWLEATAEDASTGVAMLQRSPELGAQLMVGIEHARRVAVSRAQIDPKLGTNLAKLLDRANAALTDQFETAAATHTRIDLALEQEVFAKVDALLARAAKV